ncbi:MAG: beta strand repeat-containing protein, partial [Flavobacteriales bacterium]
MGNSTNLLRLRNLALVAMVFFFNGLFAQLSGIKTIPTNYASIAAFVTDVNAQGVGAGGVTLNVPAGYTETLTGKITMTATGTAANPIIIQKSGAGANPKLTSYVGTVATPSVIADGFFVLAGSDYVTIDGIDLQESAANTTTATVMEFGYGLFLASASDGAQNNTIKNCVITLNRIQNTTWTAPGTYGSTGITAVNSLHSATGAVTPTAASGTNSNNKFYSNTIQNCNTGFAFVSYTDLAPYALSDVGNDVGGLSASTGNSILNFGGGAATNPAAAIVINNQYNFNASYNTINNNNGTGVNHTTTLRGIFANVSSNGASMNINNNTITIKSGVTTSQVSAIECSAGSSGTGNTININNNTITGCTNDLATTSLWYGIYNTGAPATLNINGNTFSSNTTKHTSGTVSLIYNTGAVTTALSMSNNNLSHGFNATVAQTGTFYGIRNTAATITANANFNNNTWSNFSFTTLSSTTAYMFYNTGGFLTNNTNNNNWNNITWNCTGTIYGFYITGATQTIFNFNNNGITTGFTRLGAAGSMYTLYFLGSSLGTCIHTVSNNNFSNITAATAGTGSFYCMYNSDGSASPYPQKNVFNNTFNNINYNTTGTFYGLYVSYLGDGTTSQGSRVYNNAVTNVTGSQTFYCMYLGSTASPNQPAKFYNNTVMNITNNSTTSSMYGVYGYSSTVAPYVEFYNNKIAGLTTATTTGKIYGFYGISGAYKFRIYNNYFGNFTASGAMTTTMPAPAIAGLYLVSTSEYKVYNNTIYLNATSTGANFSTAGLYDGATGAGIVDFRNNNVVNTSVATGSGLRIAVQNVGTATTNYASTSNNNNLNVGATSSSSLTYYDGTNTALTVLNMSAITLTDGSSVSVTPPFLSTTPSAANYLHIDATIPTQIESGGQNMPTFYTTDFDGDIRAGNAGYTGTGGTYDIGADEFNGITPAPLITALTAAPALSQLCTTAPRTITCNVTISTGTVATVMLGYSFNGVAQTPIAMTNTTGNTWSGVLPASTPVNANVFWAITATGSNGIVTNLTGSYADEPLYGVTSFAWNTGSPICAGTSTGLMANLSANLPAT